MTNRRLIEMIGGWAKAGNSMPIVTRAAQPRITRALLRTSLGLASVGIACAGLASFGGGLVDAAATAAVSTGGGYGSSREAEPSVSGLAASAPVEVSELAVTAIEASPLQGAVGEPAAPPPVVAPPAAKVVRAPLPPPAPGSVEATITEVFGADAASAIGVARCESRLNPAAISRGGGNWGLFQINTAHRSRVARMGYQWEDLLDARVNALVAKSLFDEQGWRPWACRHAA